MALATPATLPPQITKNDISLSDVKDCLTEYTLEDKVEALKNTLVHNEKHKHELLSCRNIMRDTKNKTGVKECLQANQETPFQTLISELRNTVMNSYWNNEVGRTRYQVPNLPVGMNPLETTFGKKIESEATMAELLQAKTSQIDILNKDVLAMYKKSHNSYQPGEQIKRHYKEPFDQSLVFGKSKNINIDGSRVKKLLTWINSDPTAVVNSILADFMEHSHSRVGEVRNIKNAYLYTSMIHGKANERKETDQMATVLNNCSINNDVTLQQKYLQYINSLRQKLKKRIPEIPFLDIYEDLLCLDKDYVGNLPEDNVISTLAKYKIHINKVLLTPLLDLLQIRKKNNVNYKELLNLLNWKYDFPTLPKVEKIPIECQYYSTTYKETIGNMDGIDTTNIPTAGISSGDFKDRTSAYSLIFPNVFTRHGLSHTDLFKLRSKEEIRNIFENIGVEFSDNSFDLLWEKGLKQDGTDTLSVETFRSLLDQHDSMINKIN
ncbi:EF-hand domain-containing family member B-like [Colletes gigas]|uniref:EF-hand domain-containing family member B-like n=1 Tax=Colletes gigas TaxID=935657 RepID=UPI001C9B3A99|nr:EF-hand domain-containing family member B-like [Colletes gigas]